MLLISAPFGCPATVQFTNVFSMNTPPAPSLPVMRQLAKRTPRPADEPPVLRVIHERTAVMSRNAPPRTAVQFDTTQSTMKEDTPPPATPPPYPEVLSSAVWQAPSRMVKPSTTEK